MGHSWFSAKESYLICSKQQFCNSTEPQKLRQLSISSKLRDWTGHQKPNSFLESIYHPAQASRQGSVCSIIWDYVALETSAPAKVKSMHTQTDRKVCYFSKNQITQMDDVHTVRVSRMSTWYLVPSSNSSKENRDLLKLIVPRLLVVFRP